MHQTSKFPFTFISEANCKVSNAEKTNAIRRLSEFLLRALIKATQLNSCNLLIVPWTDPGDALRWKDAQHADLFTQSNGGQRHRP